MNIPDTLKYTKDHEWVALDGDVATVGITDFAQNELGDIVFVDIQTVGESLAQGDKFGDIEAVKTVADHHGGVFLIERVYDALQGMGRRVEVVGIKLHGKASAARVVNGQIPASADAQVIAVGDEVD